MKNNSIIAVVIGALLAVIIGIIVWNAMSMKSAQSDGARQDKKLSVVTTLFPLYDFAKAVGGAYADVTLILPPGVEPHSFEPTPSDIVRINQADVFVYTGKAMEPWAEDMRSGFPSSVETVDASQGISLIEAVFHDDDEPVGSMDPHIWLDFDNAAVMVSTIEKAFENRDPAHAEAYRANAADYRAKLSALDGEYRQSFSACSTHQIVYGGHYAFGYLAKRYGLEYAAAQGIAPDAEPSAKDIADLVAQVKQDSIKYVFYEELTSPKIAETLSSETGAQLLELNAAHNIAQDDYIQGVTFLGIMEKNLVNLKVGLGCR